MNPVDPRLSLICKGGPLDGQARNIGLYDEMLKVATIPPSPPPVDFHNPRMPSLDECAVWSWYRREALERDGVITEYLQYFATGYYPQPISGEAK